MRFTALDACRGIAALLVALQRVEAQGYHAGLGIVRNAYLFVDFFFVLSGFVIAHAWGERLKSGREIASFVIRRFGRLWPLHAFILLVYVVFEGVKLIAASRGAQMTIAPFTGTHAPSTIIPNVLLIHSLGFHDYLSWNVPSWSISTEFWTYIVFAALTYVAGRGRTAIAILLVAACLALVGALSPRLMDTSHNFGFARCIAGFFAGVLTLQVWRATAHWRQELAARALLVEAGAVLLVIAFVSIAGHTALSLAAPFVFALVVYAFALEAGPLSRLLVTRPMLALGEWSYSIYMVNAFIVLMIIRAVNTAERASGQVLSTSRMIDGVEHKLLHFGPTWAMDLLALAYLAVVLAVSWATYRCIEDPSRRFFNRLSARLTGPAEPVIGQIHGAARSSPRKLMIE